MRYKKNGDHVFVVYYVLNLLEYIHDEEDYNEALEVMANYWHQKMEEEGIGKT